MQELEDRIVEEIRHIKCVRVEGFIPGGLADRERLISFIHREFELYRQRTGQEVYL